MVKTTSHAFGMQVRYGALCCVGLASTLSFAFVAEAKPKQPAPIDYARAGSRTVAPNAIAPNAVPSAVTAAPASGRVTAPRVEFRYPDQPDVIYGAGTGPRPADTNAPPIAFSSAMEAVEPAAAQAALQRAGFATPAPTFSVAAPAQVVRATAPGAGGLRPAVLDTRQRASSLESQTTSAVNAFEETGIASWYGPGFHGRETANGEVFDQEQLTAAHPTLPLPSFVEVTNLQNGRQVVVRVNDRGPFVAGRIIDVSAAAANQLGMRELGQAEVRVRYMAPAPALTATTATAVNSVPTPAAVEMPSGPRRLAPAPLVTPVTAAPALPVPTIRNASLLTMPVVPDVRPAPRTPETRSMASDSGWSNASGQSGFVVQAGSFVEIENANRLRDRIKSTGQIVGVQMASVRGSQVFRVVVGPWATKADAEAAKERLADKGFGEGLVRSNL